MRVNCAAPSQPPCTSTSINLRPPRALHPVRDSSLARYSRSTTISVYAVASTSKTESLGHVSRTPSRGATPATASAASPRSPRPKAKTRTREPSFPKDSDSPGLDTTSSTSARGSSSSRGDQQPVSSGSKNRISFTPPSKSSSAGNPSTHRNSSSSSSSSSNTPAPDDSSQNNNYGGGGNPFPSGFPSQSDPDQHARVFEPEYKATLEEFRELLSQDTLVGLEGTIPSEEADTLAQVLEDLRYVDAVQEFQDSQMSSDQGSEMETAASRRVIMPTPSVSTSPSVWPPVGVKPLKQMTIEEIKNANSRELAALHNMTDFKTYLRGLFSLLDDAQFDLALDSLGADLPVIEG
eukprot:gene11042-18646_t